MRGIFSLTYFSSFLRIQWLLQVLLLATALAATSSPPGGVMVIGSKLNVIQGLLESPSAGLNNRAESLTCSIPGGIICNTEYCCPSNAFCQPANPVGMACCLASVGFSCNDGTACCDSRVDVCCPEGCCLRDITSAPPSGGVGSGSRRSSMLSGHSIGIYGFAVGITLILANLL